MSSISIIGSGAVGQSHGEYLTTLGHDVIYYDISVESLSKIQNRQTTVSLEQALIKSEVSFICVPTAFKKEFDKSALLDVINQMVHLLEKKGHHHLVVIKSTVLPGTTEKDIQPLLKGLDVSLCVNPEFMTEISQSWTNDRSYQISAYNEARIVIGSSNKEAGDEVAKLYSASKVPIIHTDIKTAEMCKYAANCNLAMKISYWNEIHLLCVKLDIDSNIVAKIAAMDPRIGAYGTVHGKAFGGKCLPKDLKSLISLAESLGEPELLRAVDAINEKMKKSHGVRE
ncbi:MAG: NAD(P)-binding domain-containing protein [Candidatus Thermoplasmatota archaeon]|nr:NAD(P)-binding domain-containing protein [Candidatus Thermoplasmatota archaeon]MBU4591852.1 NAD(P)-binding domain-containing protein [Candidatus Thermoplasmatota archaeon]